ncbi:hypothetical protein [Lachnospira sp.]|jgi:hypothetical protein|uniref:hypothetical protein n=1 Tax=Lachnospira sp. TaxID=2049031 RepID=UPI002579E9ED|nr:hypothetical protein [Lachnospira sp.]
MKKLVFVMLAVLAMNFASCDSLAGKSEQVQDSIVYTVDSVSGDTISVDTIKADMPEVATPDSVAPEETEDNK